MAADYFCVSCRTPFQNHFPLDEHGVCRLCRSGMREFDAVYCFGWYEGVLRELIHLFKYGRMQPLSKTLSAHLLSALPLDQGFDVVVPMPLHWRRQWQRGFNQSGLLARAVAMRRGLEVAHAVRRTRATATQAGLSHAGRRANVARAFRVRKPRAIEGRRVLLVDDVITTGATASACAAALKRAGAKSVTVLALARVDRRFIEPGNNDSPSQEVS